MHVLIYCAWMTCGCHVSSKHGNKPFRLIVQRLCLTDNNNVYNNSNNKLSTTTSIVSLNKRYSSLHSRKQNHCNIKSNWYDSTLLWQCANRSNSSRLQSSRYIGPQYNGTWISHVVLATLMFYNKRVQLTSDIISIIKSTIPLDFI